MSTGGKGSRRRPESAPDAYESGYDRIFGKKAPEGNFQGMAEAELERRWAAISQASEAAKAEQDKEEVPSGGPMFEFTIEASRECAKCGWTLPDGITGYVGPCPDCEADEPPEGWPETLPAWKATGRTE